MGPESHARDVHNDDKQIVRLASMPFKSRPSIEAVDELLRSNKFHELITSIHYLKEYHEGLQIIEALVSFVEAHPRLNLHNPKHRRAIVRLWRLKLALLDVADEWDDYLKTVSALKKRSKLVEETPARHIDQQMYEYDKHLLERRGVSRVVRDVAQARLKEVEACEYRDYDATGRWSVKLPASLRHITDDWHVRHRTRVIQRKVDLRNAGRRADYLRHKQVSDLTEEEYNRRVEWLRVWKSYCNKCRESIRRAVRNR